MVQNVSDISKAQKAKLIKSGKWFVFSGKLFPSQKALKAAQAASTKSGPRQAGSSKSIRAPVNTSSLFWSNYPGARENVKYTAKTTLTIANMVSRNMLVGITDGSVTTTEYTWSGTMPPQWELTGLALRFECELFAKDVILQVAVLLAKSVRDVSALTWKQVVENPAVQMFQDVRSANSSHKLKIGRPVNTSSDTDEACLVVMTRAVDTDPASGKKVDLVVELTVSQLKAVNSTLDL